MTTFFSLDDYVEPKWKGNPRYQYYFQIIKEGSFIGTLPIKNKSFHLIGKLEDLCDIFIDNATVSRKHAILQFKDGQPCPYIYDLGSTHGTRVNKISLPARTYQKLTPFEMIKFGMSSRSYILRCLQVQQLLEKQQENKGQDFMNTIQVQHTQMSKEQMKERYLDLLENDPYHKAQNQSRKLVGSEAKKESKMQGIDWGITDEDQIYAYRSEYQFQLQPDLLRRLPGLQQAQLNKISQFETNFAKYQEIQSQLNQLSRKQKKQFGLEEGQRAKKEKLEKRLVQALQFVEKNEEWIRKNLFGEEIISQKPQHKKQRQQDEYQNDQFLDRTLADKNKQNIKKQQKQKQDLTTTDYWQLRKQLEEKIKRKIQLNHIIKQNNNKKEQMDEEDELEAFMKVNNAQLDYQNATLAQKQLYDLMREIDEFIHLLSLKDVQITAIQNKIRGIQQNMSDPEIQKIQQKKRQQQRLSSVMRQLQERQRQRIALDEENVEIFKYYSKQMKQEQQIQKMKRARQDYQQKLDGQQTSKKIKVQGSASYPKLHVARDKITNQEQQIIDLTKN